MNSPNLASTSVLDRPAAKASKSLRKETTHNTRDFAPDHLLTSHEVGQLLQMNPTSINNWARAGKLPAFRTPGGHRRIRCEDLAVFLEVHQMAVPSSLEQLTYRRLVWAESDEFQQNLLRAAAEKKKIKLWLVNTMVEALALVGHVQPHVLGVSLNALKKDAVSPVKLRSCLHAEARANGIQVLTYGRELDAESENAVEMTDVTPQNHRDRLPQGESLTQWMQGVPKEKAF